jgi:hypothetical protein
MEAEDGANLRESMPGQGGYGLGWAALPPIVHGMQMQPLPPACCACHSAILCYVKLMQS